MTCDLTPALVLLPPGEFMMGETADDKFATATERPAHRVTVSQSFALGRSPVTVGEYRAFAAQGPDEHDDSLPVVQVTWEEARSFCAWLGAQTGNPYRLPTEAEWEYACRAGGQTPFATGTELTAKDANFLYNEEGERIGPGRRSPGGTYPANAFGLEDLHGNVCEWVHDSWHRDYLDAPQNGSAWIDSKTNLRVIRGGAWDYLPRLLRCAWRDSLPQNHRRDNLGFRVACTLDS
jgi:formylglycine-generating enzyme required for sulfatase activity